MNLFLNSKSKEKICLFPAYFVIANLEKTKSKWICFLIQNQEKNLFDNTHSNGSWSENISPLCLFCDSTFREKTIWENT